MRLSDIMEMENVDYKQDDEVEARVRALHRFLRNVRRRGANEILADDVGAIMGFKEET